MKKSPINIDGHIFLIDPESFSKSGLAHSKALLIPLNPLDSSFEG
jgi:hypothetical protein